MTNTETTKALFPLHIVSTITVNGEERDTWHGSPCTTEQAGQLLQRMTNELTTDLAAFYGITAEVIGGENENFITFTDPIAGDRVERTIAVRRVD